MFEKQNGQLPPMRDIGKLSTDGISTTIDGGAMSPGPAQADPSAKKSLFSDSKALPELVSPNDDTNELAVAAALVNAQVFYSNLQYSY